MKMNIYIDFEDKKVYTEETLYQEAEKIAEEFDKIRGDRFEDFLCRDDKYYSYHEYNVDAALNNLENNTTKFKIDV